MEIRNLERQKAMAEKKEKEKIVQMKKREAKAAKLRATFLQNQQLLEQKRQELIQR